MARKRQQAAEAEAPQAPETPPAEEPVQTAPASAETPAAETQPGATGTRRQYNPVRSWSERYQDPIRYEMLTDGRMGKILFRFKLPDGEKTPSEEALAVMRSHKQTPEGQPSGLKFEDTRTHGKVWTIPNDEEGRELAGRIEAELNKVASKQQGGPTPPV